MKASLFPGLVGNHQRISGMLLRLIENLLSASQFFDDVIVDEQLLASDNYRTAKDSIVEVLEHPGRGLQGASRSQRIDRYDCRQSHSGQLETVCFQTWTPHSR